MKSVVSVCLVTVSMLIAAAAQANAAPVGSVVCNSLSGERRQNAMAFSAISPANSRTGYTLLIVENTGSFVLSLNHNLQVTDASSIEGQTLVPWNLVAYDGRPLTIARNGTFSLDMMVSSRSSCQFQGTTTFLQGAETTLFKN